VRSEGAGDHDTLQTVEAHERMTLYNILDNAYIVDDCSRRRFVSWQPAFVPCSQLMDKNCGYHALYVCAFSNSLLHLSCFVSCHSL